MQIASTLVRSTTLPVVREVSPREVEVLKLEASLRQSAEALQSASGTGTLQFSMAHVEQHLFDKGEVAYLAEWEGEEIPDELEIAGARVAWLRGNEVRFIQHGCTGLYERLVRNGGASGREQKILVYFSPFVVTEVTTDAEYQNLKFEQSVRASEVTHGSHESATVSIRIPKTPNQKLPSHERVFCVEWRGEAAPRGLEIVESRVVSAHQNLLILSGRYRTGQYEVIYRHRGDKQNEQKILVNL